MIKSSSEVFQELSNSDIFTTHDCGETNHYKLAYLDFVDISEEEQNGFEHVFDGPRIGLKLKEVQGPLDAVNINPDDIDALDAYDKLTDIAVDMIIERAYKNSERDESRHFNVDLLKPNYYFSDEKKREEIQGPNHGRKLLTRILGISNLIAITGRRGPANYVILPENLYKILESVFARKYKGLYKANELEASIAGLTLLCSDKLKDDQFIVGRKTCTEERGLHLITSDKNLSNYIVNTPDDMVQKVGFKLLFVGDEDKDCTVYGCKVNWTNETI